MRKLFFTSIICGLFLFALPALGAEYYIDAQNGNDASSGSMDHPWQTLDKITGISGGDTVYLKGDFTPATPIIMLAALSGTAAQPTIITNWPDYQANIQAIPGDANFVTLNKYISFSGLRFHNNDIFASGSVAIVPANEIRDVSISRCQFYDVEFGIVASAGPNSDGLKISDNDFSNNGLCVQMISTNNSRVLRNNFHDLNASGPKIAFFSILNTEGIYANNFFSNADVAFWDIQTNNDKIINNTFYNSNTGLYSIESNNMNFKNNIISDSGTYAIHLEDGTNLGFDYNLFNNNANIGFIEPAGTTAVTLSDWKALGYGAHSLKGKPRYWSKDQATLDLHIKKKSDAKNAGTNLSSYLSKDVDSEVRPHGSAFDIGADEFYGYKPARVTGVTIKDGNFYKKKVKLKWGKQTNETLYVIKLFSKKMKVLKKIKTKNLGKANKYIKKLKPGKSYRVKVLAKRTVRYRTFKSAQWSKVYKFQTKQ